MTRCVCTVAALLGAGLATAAPYQLDRSHSFVIAVTDKSGLFSMAGHRHAILAARWSADLSVDPASLAESSMSVTVPAAALVADSPEARRRAGLGAGPSAGDVPKIQEKMLGPEVLDAAQYPDIRFELTSVAVSAPDLLSVTGRLTLHGQTRPVKMAVKFSQNANGFVFHGTFPLRQSDFGIAPPSVGLGTVKVKNEVEIRFQVAVVPAPR
jgi:polyisoprenoid-binding protein YceI